MLVLIQVKIILRKFVCNRPFEHFFPISYVLFTGNPYNEVIDFEDVDALNESVETLSTSKKESSKSKTSSSKKSSTDKPQKPTNQSSKRPALVVQQMPPPIMLPPSVSWIKFHR